MGPIRDPASARRSYYDLYAKGAISRGQASFRVIEGTPMQPLVQGGQTMLLLVEVSSAQGTARALALVSVSPVDSENWLFYMSQVAAPAKHFAEQLPVMM